MKTMSLECQLPVTRRNPAKVSAPDSVPPTSTGRVLKVARWLALAMHYERLIEAGVIADAATLARESQLTRARISQIMNLVFLAPVIQEALLNWPRLEAGRDPITLKDLQPIALTLDWNEQRQQWRNLLRTIEVEQLGSDANA